jgi:rhodanese-related sulfurtransferase
MRRDRSLKTEIMKAHAVRKESARTGWIQPKLLERVLTGILFGMTLSARVGVSQAAEPAVGEPRATVADKPLVFDAILRDQASCPEVNTTEFRAALENASAVVLDARPDDEYAVSHIPGARAVPGKPGTTPALYVADVNAILSTIPDKNQPLILYCNGLNCGRSKRFGDELLKAGYQNVRRYQLGAPVWRALGGVMQVEKQALVRLLAEDSTAVLIDARETGGLTPQLRNARSIPLRDSSKAKDDGRLPMTDHNTRIFVVGNNADQARAVAEAIVHDAFQNVSFFDGSIADLTELYEK